MEHPGSPDEEERHRVRSGSVEHPRSPEEEEEEQEEEEGRGKVPRCVNTGTQEEELKMLVGVTPERASQF